MGGYLLGKYKQALLSKPTTNATVVRLRYAQDRTKYNLGYFIYHGWEMGDVCPSHR